MSLALTVLTFTAEINALPIDGFTINGFGVTTFQTFKVIPLEAAEFSAVAALDGTEADDECCTGVMVPPERPPLRTPWGFPRWSR